MNLDTGNFRGSDPYAEIAQLAPYAMNVQVKTEIQRGNGHPKEEADLARIVGILRDAHYSGYVVLEYEAAEDPIEGDPHAYEDVAETDQLKVAWIDPTSPGSSAGPMETFEMIVGVPKEVKPDEYRVAMLPVGAEELSHAGHTVLIEAGAGQGSGIADASYKAAGATIVCRCGRDLGQCRARGEGQGASACGMAVVTARYSRLHLLSFCRR